MKKKIALITACLTLTASAAMASPLTDYSKGNVSIDLNYRNTQNSANYGGNSFDWPKKYNLEPSITIGLGNNFAFQYRNVNSKSGNVDLTGMGYTENHKLALDEFNILYRLSANVSAFAGYVSTKETYNNAYTPMFMGTGRNFLQLGLVGSVPLTNKVTAYGVLGAGDNYVNYELGLSYAFTKNFEFNVDYRNLKVKNFEVTSSDREDVNVKGLGFGVTYKF